MQNKTIHLSYNVFDRYLSRNQVPIEKIQLFGTTAFWIACKNEEISPVQLSDCIYLCQHTYLAKEFIEAEGCILEEINFDLQIPTDYEFYEALSFLCGFSEEEFYVGLMWLEFTCFLDSFLRVKPSERALVIIEAVSQVYRGHK